MQKIKDERLILLDLKMIRITFLVQTAGIIGILGYDLITAGFEGMRQNPLWIVFMITTVLYTFLSTSISVDYFEGTKTYSKKGLQIGFGIITIISVLWGYLTSISEGNTALEGFIVGGVIFASTAIPLLYVHYLRKKRTEE
ncbi:hypothetical protein WAK64_08280 [Bacillus spongiae]|uniref:Branched-chain amino acid ABC transporter substrate-binding protein n=1 Tax=Bacillus spongiae TaxID=2683610 RepID=A0ABU8HCN8_9BACI